MDARMRDLALPAAGLILGLLAGLLLGNSEVVLAGGYTGVVAWGALVLVLAWGGIAAVARAVGPATRVRRLGFVLGVGLVPLSAMLSAGPIVGLYGVFYPAIVLGPLALLLAIARARSPAAVSPRARPPR